MARYKAKANKKLIIALVCVVLAAVLTVIAAIGSKGFTIKNPKNYFNNWGKPTTETETRVPWGGVVDGDGKTMNAAVTYSMPNIMAFYSTTSDNVTQNSNFSSPSVTVTCSHNFEFNNIKVDWSIEYPSGASASDVVTVTPESDGSTRATVQCVIPFDMQLTLKATLRGNTEKTATCTIDYVKRILSFPKIYITGNDFTDYSGLEVMPEFSAGTITGDLNVKRVSYSLDTQFKNDVAYYLTFPITFTSFDTGNKSLTLSGEYYAYDGSEEWAYNMFIKDFDNFDEAHKKAIYYAWNTAYKCGNYSKECGTVIVNIDIDVIYNGVVLQTEGEIDYTSPVCKNSLNGYTFGYNIAPDLTLNTNVVL